jgi:hypothetical protein
MKEHDMVVLRESLPQSRLESGDIGTVVHVYADGGAFEVEFATGDGSTLAVLTLVSSQIRPVGSREIYHSRPVG